MIARRLIVVLAAALLFSSIVTFWLSRHMAHVHAASTATERVLVAARDIPAGQPLAPDMLKLADWPTAAPLHGTFTKPDELKDRIALVPLAAGDPILDRQLVPPGVSNGLTRRIPAGLRAIAVKSDEVAGVAGFLSPGSLVDVLATSTSFNTAASTTTILQGAQVLAAGQNTEPDPNGKPVTATVVTLLVDPQDAEKLALAASSGKIQFVLRNGADRQQIANLIPARDTNSAASQPVVNNAPAPAANKPKAPAAKPTATPHTKDTVEVVTGGSKSNEPALPGSKL